MKNIKEIPVPDIGDFDEVEVIEILVSAGDQVEAEDSLISLESDKATMEIPSPEAGTVEEVKVSLGDKVSVGNIILLLESSASGEVSEVTGDAALATKEAAPAPQNIPDTEPAQPSISTEASDEMVPYAPDTVAGRKRSHASPSVRRFASCPRRRRGRSCNWFSSWPESDHRHRPGFR